MVTINPIKIGGHGSGLLTFNDMGNGGGGGGGDANIALNELTTIAPTWGVGTLRRNSEYVGKGIKIVSLKQPLPSQDIYFDSDGFISEPPAYGGYTRISKMYDQWGSHSDDIERGDPLGIRYDPVNLLTWGAVHGYASWSSFLSRDTTPPPEWLTDNIGAFWSGIRDSTKINSAPIFQIGSGATKNFSLDSGADTLSVVVKGSTPAVIAASSFTNFPDTTDAVLQSIVAQAFEGSISTWFDGEADATGTYVDPFSLSGNWNIILFRSPYGRVEAVMFDLCLFDTAVGISDTDVEALSIKGSAMERRSPVPYLGPADDPRFVDSATSNTNTAMTIDTSELTGVRRLMVGCYGTTTSAVKNIVSIGGVAVTTLRHIQADREYAGFYYADVDCTSDTLNVAPATGIRYGHNIFVWDITDLDVSAAVSGIDEEGYRLDVDVNEGDAVFAVIGGRNYSSVGMDGLPIRVSNAIRSVDGYFGMAGSDPSVAAAGKAYAVDMNSDNDAESFRRKSVIIAMPLL